MKPEDRKCLDQLIKREKDLKPILRVYEYSLSVLNLSDDQKAVIISIIQQHSTELNNVSGEIQKIRITSKPQPTVVIKKRVVARKKTTVNKNKTLNAQLAEYEAVRRRERERVIEKTHEVSKFNSRPVFPVQGGSPGSGKRS